MADELMPTEYGTAVEDHYNYGGTSVDEINGAGDFSISLDSILAKPDAPKSVSGFDMGKMFSSDKLGSTMQGIGAIAQAAAGIYDAHNKKKYQDKVFKMEEKRVARETERQDKQQAAYEKVFG